MDKYEFTEQGSATLDDVRDEISGVVTALLMIHEELKALRVAFEGPRVGDRGDL